jgi:hypothetical protein
MERALRREARRTVPSQDRPIDRLSDWDEAARILERPAREAPALCREMALRRNGFGLIFFSIGGEGFSGASLHDSDSAHAIDS